MKIWNTICFNESLPLEYKFLHSENTVFFSLKEAEEYKRKKEETNLYTVIIQEEEKPLIVCFIAATVSDGWGAAIMGSDFPAFTSFSEAKNKLDELKQKNPSYTIVTLQL